MVGSAALFFLVKNVITVFNFEMRLHMPRLSKNSLPKYRLHRPSGRAVVTLSGKVHYLGKNDSAESRDLYNRLISEWLTVGQAFRPNEPRLRFDNFRTLQCLPPIPEAEFLV